MELVEVMSALREFIRTTFDIGQDDAEFTDDVHLFDYGYVDSFGATELIGFSETRFGVTISDVDLVTLPLNTIREIGTVIAERTTR